MIIKFLYNLYHLIFQSSGTVCRYSPTCSKYALESIQKYGYFKGGYRSIVRILSCHPFSKKPHFDPVI